MIGMRARRCKVPSIEVEYISTNSILRHPRNPKKHPEEQIHRLEASIQKFGWTSPIILSSDGYILAGHARYEAAYLGRKK